MAKEKVSVGIDLGTTFSSVAVCGATSKVEVVQNDGLQDSIPSWVSFSKCPEEVFVGGVAKNDVNADYVAYDSKRLIGKRERIRDTVDNWPFDVRKHPSGLYQMGVANPERDGEEDNLEYFFPEEISAMILSELMDYVKRKYENVDIGKIIVTVPAEFDDSQRLATMRACKLAGFKDFELLYEPSASIIHYMNLTNADLETVVVIDFGGGTLDVSCCEINGKDIKVVSTGGDQNIGGNNFDECIMDLIKEKLGEAINNVDDLFDEEQKRLTQAQRKRIKLNKKNLKTYAEQLKKDFANSKTVRVVVRNIFSDSDIEKYHIPDDITISLEEFREASEGIMETFMRTVKKIMNKAKFRPNKVSLVLPVGGSCKIQFVKDAIEEYFKGSPLCNEPRFDPLLSVVMGAAAKSGEAEMGLEANHLYETIPYPIGFEYSQKMVDVFVRPGDTLPATKRKEYFPKTDNQESVKYSIYRGDSQFADSCDKVAETIISGLPAQYKRTEYPMTVQIDIDQNGICQVKVWRKGHEDTPIGSLKVELDLHQYDALETEMINHMKEFGFHC